MAHDCGDMFSAPAAMANMTDPDAAMEITSQTVRFLSGSSYTRECEVERMMRDSKITRV